MIHKNNKTMKEQQILTWVNLRKDKLGEDLSKEIKRLKKNHSTEYHYQSKLEEVIPSVVKVLKEQGLEIRSINSNKTGRDENWKEEDYLKVNMTAIPISGKVKFIKFDGYTVNGTGRNQKRLQEKAKKLQNIIKEGAALYAVAVNPYSFEISSSTSMKSILIDFWIK